MHCKTKQIISFHGISQQHKPVQHIAIHFRADQFKSPHIIAWHNNTTQDNTFHFITTRRLKIMEDENKVLVGIVVQQYQPVTSNGVIEIAKNLGKEMEIEDVIYVLENMQRRDLLSVAYQTKDNKKVKAYAMGKPMFKKSPEMAHLKDMLPTLTKSKEAKEFLKMLEGQTSETKKVRELGYRDYKLVKLKLDTIEPIVGGNLNKPSSISKEIEGKIKELESKSKKKKNTEEDFGQIAYFNRNPQGELIYSSNQVRQYFLKNLRIAGIGETAVNQIYFNSASINANGHKFYVDQWPVIVGGQGRGIKSAEALPAGISIELSFSYPFTGTKIKSPDQLKKVLEYITVNGRGFSSYSKKYGKCKLVEFGVEELKF